MKKLIEMDIKEYLDMLKSDAPAPGGGSVSALAGAQGIGLAMMVADLTLGKEKFQDFFPICQRVKEEGERLFENLSDSIDADTEAFNLVAAAFKMPKDTEEDKAARSEAIQAGTLKSTEVPFQTMKLAFEGLLLAEAMIGHSNPNCESDLGVAVLNLSAAVNGAWMNVLINLDSLKDKTAAEKFRAQGQDIFDEANQIAHRALKKVL